jgi:hypothetical protein
VIKPAQGVPKCLGSGLSPATSSRTGRAGEQLHVVDLDVVGALATIESDAGSTNLPAVAVALLARKSSRLAERLMLAPDAATQLPQLFGSTS